jgi:hypothetical protein
LKATLIFPLLDPPDRLLKRLIGGAKRAKDLHENLSHPLIILNLHGKNPLISYGNRDTIHGACVSYP